MGRKPIVAMNWSMRQNEIANAVEFAAQLIDEIGNDEEIEKIIFPSMGTLPAVAEVVKNTSIKIGAQNIAPYEHGEYSGEYSIESLLDIQGQYVELGHWERRKQFGDTDELINKKILLTLKHHLTPILCVGEENKTEDYQEIYTCLKRQLFNNLLDAEEADISRLIVVYTPLWAVGKTRAASAPHIHRIGQLIRKILNEFYSATTVEKISILYGGSVCPENVDLIVRDEAIDGVLVGRFGSNPARYAEVVRKVSESKILI